MYKDILSYLPDDILCKVDRASMYHSLETRAPFLDHNLVEFAFKIDNKYKIRNGQGKWISKKLLSKYLPLKFLSKSKTGFSVPIDNWLRGPLREWSENLIEKKNIDQFGILNYESVAKLWSEHLKGINKNKQLWNILILQSWLLQKDDY